MKNWPRLHITPAKFHGEWNYTIAIRAGEIAQINFSRFLSRRRNRLVKFLKNRAGFG